MALILFIISLLLITSVGALSSPSEKHIGIRPELSNNSYAHRSAIESGIEIKIASTEKGLGAFARKMIPAGTLLCQYQGEILTKSQVQSRYWGKRKPNRSDLMWAQSRKDRNQGLTGHYVVELPSGVFVDGEDAEQSSWSRFMNTEKEGTKKCNVKPFMQTTIDGPEHTYPQMYTIRDVAAGEELCWDYGEMFWLPRASETKW